MVKAATQSGMFRRPPLGALRAGRPLPLPLGPLTGGPLTGGAPAAAQPGRIHIPYNVCVPRPAAVVFAEPEKKEFIIRFPCPASPPRGPKAGRLWKTRQKGKLYGVPRFGNVTEIAAGSVSFFARPGVLGRRPLSA